MEGVEEAIQFINEREKPLVMYVFTESSTTFQHFNKKTSAGALLQNDTLIYYTGTYSVWVGMQRESMQIY